MRNKKVLDIHGGKDEEGRGVVAWAPHNGKNQKWSIVYLDQSKKEPTSGLNRKWGLYINRPFVIQSRLPMHRVIEVVGARNLVIRSKVYGRRA